MQNLIRKATRQKAKIRLGLSATSGSGKTYSALLIAFGLCGDWSKIGVVDTENGSADLYAHLGDYNVITLQAPYAPERYIECIKAFEAHGVEVIVIDSITHEWDGPGGVLSISNAMAGNSYTNWAKLTPRHDAFIQAILQSSAHVITTVRRKQDYEMSKNSDGKATVTKLGLKEVTRDGFEYEVTANLELDTAHFATASKDRTGLFSGKPAFVPTVETGKILKAWCESGAEPLPVQDGRIALTVTHTAWAGVYDAIVNKGYTVEQAEGKYKFDEETLAKINEGLAAKNTPPPATETKPFTQQDIKETITPTNGQQTKRPF